MRVTIPPLPNTPSWYGSQLKHRKICTFNLTFIILSGICIKICTRSNSCQAELLNLNFVAESIML